MVSKIQVEEIDNANSTHETLILEPESSDINIDFITAVVADGTVYSVVALVVVKSTFLFTKEFAISL